MGTESDQEVVLMVGRDPRYGDLLFPSIQECASAGIYTQQQALRYMDDKEGQSKSILCDVFIAHVPKHEAKKVATCAPPIPAVDEELSIPVVEDPLIVSDESAIVVVDEGTETPRVTDTDTDPTENNGSNQVEEEEEEEPPTAADVDSLEHDTGLRSPISIFDVNEQDSIRRSLHLFFNISQDYVGNKRLELPGQLISLLFEDLFKTMNSHVVERMYKTSGKTHSSALDFSQLIREENIITTGLERSISTGNWDIKRFRMHRKGVSQVLSRLSYMASLGYMTRITSQFEKNRKTSGPRALQPSQV
ncbi:unnamed protein product [Miscanthus lutarioriparius]|uniref:DNA-directed RNA polymerase n=1 Tax=Miscanthus lutarioriparius TaxID=422564 RepID=A0A811Q2I5_9POAL|nr:unnamed protein product [Miscanthus lutarioriparius]